MKRANGLERNGISVRRATVDIAGKKEFLIAIQLNSAGGSRGRRMERYQGSVLEVLNTRDAEIASLWNILLLIVQRRRKSILEEERKGRIMVGSRTKGC